MYICCDNSLHNSLLICRLDGFQKRNLKEYYVNVFECFFKGCPYYPTQDRGGLNDHTLNSVLTSAFEEFFTGSKLTKLRGKHLCWRFQKQLGGPFVVASAD